ncbi:MAG: hypothetical protein WDO24_19315 [Pseudomonadota bacterium]
MTTLSRRDMLAGSAALVAASAGARAQSPAVTPRVTVISQWSAGSDGAAITALGKVFEQEGGIWQHSPVPGFTTEMMNKLRAQILAGDPPAALAAQGTRDRRVVADRADRRSRCAGRRFRLRGRGAA